MKCHIHLFMVAALASVGWGFGCTLADGETSRARPAGLPATQALVAATRPAGTAPSGIPVLDPDALGDFDFDDFDGTTADIPERFRRLDGRRVRVVGYMIQGDSPEHIHTFILTHRPPGSSDTPSGHDGYHLLVQKKVDVKVVGEEGVTLSFDPVIVSGTLHVAVHKEDFQVVSVYQLDADRMEPAPAVDGPATRPATGPAPATRPTNR
jgi:hypothetical protein